MADEQKPVQTPADDKEVEEQMPEEVKNEEKKENEPSTSTTKGYFTPKPRDDDIKDNPNIEYEHLINRVKKQNELYNSLKLKLSELRCQEYNCSNACSIKQICCRLEVEKTNLRLLVQEVVKFQRDHPNGPWEDIEIATHLSEDNIPDRKNAALSAAMVKMQQGKECKEQ